MLRKENRLKKNRDFQIVQKIGRSYYGTILGAKVAQNNLKETRIGIVAANKIFKNAPERNKTRRRVREILRNRVKDFKKGLDVIFFLKKGINEKSFKELAETIDKLIERTNIAQEHE